MLKREILNVTGVHWSKCCVIVNLKCQSMTSWNDLFQIWTWTRPFKEYIDNQQTILVIDAYQNKFYRNQKIWVSYL